MGPPESTAPPFAELLASLGTTTTLSRHAPISEAGLDAAVELLAAVKETILRLDGLKLASISRISQLQAKQAEESVSGRKPPLPGKERTLENTLTVTGMQSEAETSRELKQARAMADYPRFGRVIEQGNLSDAYLDVLTSLIRGDAVARARQDEEALLATALNEPVEQFRKAVRSWKVARYPARAEVEAKKQAAQESFTVFPDRGGYRLSGWLTALNGTVLNQAIRDEVGVPARDDYRRPQERNAEALMGLVRSAGGTRTGSRHEILVHVPLSTLVQTEKASCVGADCSTVGVGLGHRGSCLDEREEQEASLGAVLSTIRAGLDVAMFDGFAPATLPDGSPLAPSQLAQMMCDSHVTRAVFTAHGEPIDVSRRQRLFSARQAKAVVGRDRHCQFPGCTRGPEQGEIHHAQEWERGGPTIVDNAVLLCFAHHEVIHRDQITITHHQGGFVFIGREGESIGTSRTRALAA